MTAAGFLIFGEIFEIFDEFLKFSNACTTKLGQKFLIARFIKKWRKSSRDNDKPLKVKKKNFEQVMVFSVTDLEFG